MLFEQALAELRNGHRVSRDIWRGAYTTMNNGALFSAFLLLDKRGLLASDGLGVHSCHLTINDILADDWVDLDPSHDEVIDDDKPKPKAKRAKKGED